MLNMLRNRPLPIQDIDQEYHLDRLNKLIIDQVRTLPIYVDFEIITKMIIDDGIDNVLGHSVKIFFVRQVFHKLCSDLKTKSLSTKKFVNTQVYEVYYNILQNCITIFFKYIHELYQEENFLKIFTQFMKPYLLESEIKPLTLNQYFFKNQDRSKIRAGDIISILNTAEDSKKMLWSPAKVMMVDQNNIIVKMLYTITNQIRKIGKDSKQISMDPSYINKFDWRLQIKEQQKIDFYAGQSLWCQGQVIKVQVEGLGRKIIINYQNQQFVFDQCNPNIQKYGMMINTQQEILEPQYVNASIYTQFDNKRIYCWPVYAYDPFYFQIIDKMGNLGYFDKLFQTLAQTCDIRLFNTVLQGFMGTQSCFHPYYLKQVLNKLKDIYMKIITENFQQDYVQMIVKVYQKLKGVQIFITGGKSCFQYNCNALIIILTKILKYQKKLDKRKINLPKVYKQNHIKQAVRDLFKQVQKNPQLTQRVNNWLVSQNIIEILFVSSYQKYLSMPIIKFVCSQNLIKQEQWAKYITIIYQTKQIQNWQKIIYSNKQYLSHKQVQILVMHKFNKIKTQQKIQSVIITQMAATDQKYPSEQIINFYKDKLLANQQNNQNNEQIIKILMNIAIIKPTKNSAKVHNSQILLKDLVYMNINDSYKLFGIYLEGFKYLSTAKKISDNIIQSQIISNLQIFDDLDTYMLGHLNKQNYFQFLTKLTKIYQCFASTPLIKFYYKLYNHLKCKSTYQNQIQILFQNLHQVFTSKPIYSQQINQIITKMYEQIGINNIKESQLKFLSVFIKSSNIYLGNLIKSPKFDKYYRYEEAQRFVGFEISEKIILQSRNQKISSIFMESFLMACRSNKGSMDSRQLFDRYINKIYGAIQRNDYRMSSKILQILDTLICESQIHQEPITQTMSSQLLENTQYFTYNKINIKTNLNDTVRTFKNKIYNYLQKNSIQQQISIQKWDIQLTEGYYVHQIVNQFDINDYVIQFMQVKNKQADVMNSDNLLIGDRINPRAKKCLLKIFQQYSTDGKMYYEQANEFIMRVLGLTEVLDRTKVFMQQNVQGQNNYITKHRFIQFYQQACHARQAIVLHNFKMLGISGYYSYRDEEIKLPCLRDHMNQKSILSRQLLQLLSKQETSEIAHSILLRLQVNKKNIENLQQITDLDGLRQKLYLPYYEGLYNLQLLQIMVTKYNTLPKSVKNQVILIKQLTFILQQLLKQQQAPNNPKILKIYIIWKLIYWLLIRHFSQNIQQKINNEQYQYVVKQQIAQQTEQQLINKLKIIQKITEQFVVYMYEYQQKQGQCIPLYISNQIRNMFTGVYTLKTVYQQQPNNALNMINFCQKTKQLNKNNIIVFYKNLFKSQKYRKYLVLNYKKLLQKILSCQSKQNMEVLCDIVGDSVDCAEKQLADIDVFGEIVSMFDIVIGDDNPIKQNNNKQFNSIGKLLIRIPITKINNQIYHKIMQILSICVKIQYIQCMQIYTQLITKFSAISQELLRQCQQTLYQSISQKIKDQQFLKYITQNQIQCSDLCLGIQNLGSLGYMNCVFYLLFTTSKLLNIIMLSELTDIPQRKQHIDFIYQLRRMFLYLKDCNKSIYNPKPLLTCLQKITKKQINPIQQQDAFLFLLQILQIIRNSLKYPQQIDKLINIQIKRQLKCLNCQQQKIYTDNMNIIYITRWRNRKVTLNQLIQEEQQINDWFCEKCQIKCVVSSDYVIQRMPQILFIHLKKVQFDYDKFEPVIQNHLYNAQLNYKYISDQQDNDKQYTLTSAICHTSSKQQNHYYYIKKQSEQQGTIYDDILILPQLHLDFQLNKQGVTYIYQNKHKYQQQQLWNKIRQSKQNKQIVDRIQKQKKYLQIYSQLCNQSIVWMFNKLMFDREYTERFWILGFNMLSNIWSKQSLLFQGIFKNIVDIYHQNNIKTQIMKCIINSKLKHPKLLIYNQHNVQFLQFILLFRQIQGLNNHQKCQLSQFYASIFMEIVYSQVIIQQQLQIGYQLLCYCSQNILSNCSDTIFHLLIDKYVDIQSSTNIKNHNLITPKQTLRLRQLRIPLLHIILFIFLQRPSQDKYHKLSKHKLNILKLNLKYNYKSKLIAKLCFQNYQQSKQIAYYLLSLIQKKSLQFNNCYYIIQVYLGIDDQYSYDRMRWILGEQRVDLDMLEKIGEHRISSLDFRFFRYASPLNNHKCLLEQTFTQRYTQPEYVLKLINFILEMALKTETNIIRKYITSQMNPCIQYSSFIQLWRHFVQDFQNLPIFKHRTAAITDILLLQTKKMILHFDSNQIQDTKIRIFVACQRVQQKQNIYSLRTSSIFDVQQIYWAVSDIKYFIGIQWMLTLQVDIFSYQTKQQLTNNKCVQTKIHRQRSQQIYTIIDFRAQLISQNCIYNQQQDILYFHILWQY